MRGDVTTLLVMLPRTAVSALWLVEILESQSCQGTLLGKFLQQIVR